ncbi:MAG: DUF2855 family protein [Burkholderiaceae bacterium]
MTRQAGHRLFIDRARLTDARVGADPDAPGARDLEAGQARLAVELFALTANNVTYAAFGDAMKYWRFFPSGDAALGCLPVWGFATVEESRVEGLRVGRRVWGYYPAGSHLVVSPSTMSVAGFADGAAHRQELPSVYNQYAFCDADPAWRPELEGLQAVLRPLFVTSFMADDFLAENQFFGAQQVLVSSASSKTAFGTAHCLARRRGTPGAPKIVGLTSAVNAAFVRSLGCYDEVRLYDEVPALSPEPRTVYLDFAGNAELRRAVHATFAGTLMFNSAIGGAHWEDLAVTSDLPGPRPTLFFAPIQLKKRGAPPPVGWGEIELQRRIGAGWTRFISDVADGGWVRVERRPGQEAALQAYMEMLAGRVNGRQGLILGMQAREP